MPVEVIEHIIDSFASDKRTLKACALTGRAWLPRARYHLYRTLVVRRGGRDPYKLRFYPAVARCVRRVIVHDGLWNEVSNSVLVKLGHVERLHLSISYGHMQRDISAAQFPHFPALKELRLENVAFHSGDELLSILRDMRNLTSVSIPLTSMNYLTAENLERLAAPYRSTPVHLPLQFVHLLVRPTPGPVAREILAMAGPSLKNLSIRIVSLSSGLRPTCKLSHPCALQRHSHSPSVNLMRELDLSRNTALETVFLHFYWSDPLWYYSTPRAEHDATLAGAFLAAVHSPHLRSLRLRIVAPGEHEHLRWLRYFDIGFLDAFAEPVYDAGLSVGEMQRALARAKGLQSVQLELKFTCALEETELSRVRRHVGDQLPALRRRNLLQIECIQ